MNKQGNQKLALKAAHQHAFAVQQQGGPPLEEAAHRGRCGQVARSHGGFAFRQRQRLASQPSPVALASRLSDASLECTLAIIRRESLACGREVAAVEHRRRERLQSWATALRSCLPFPGATQENGVTPVPLGPKAEADAFEWVLDSRVLHRTLSAPLPSLHGSMLAAWKERHKPILNSSTTHFRPGTPANSTRLCFIASFCLCGLRMAPLRWQAHRLQQALRRCLTKGTTLRRLYDTGVMFFCCSTPDAPNLEYWAYLGYANLNTMHIALAPVAKHPDPHVQGIAADMERVHLVFRPPEDALAMGFLNVWQFLRPLDRDLAWLWQPYRLLCNPCVEVSDFTPSEHLVVEAIAGQPKVLFWQGVAQRAPQGDPPLHIAPEVDPPEDLAPLVDQVPDDMEELPTDSDTGEHDPWNFEDEDEDDPPPSPARLPPPVPEGDPPPPLAPEVDPPLLSAPEANPVMPLAPKQRYVPFPVRDEQHRLLGHLVLNRKSGSLDAHCECQMHKVDGPCHTNRSLKQNDLRPAQGRPLGFLVAWLHAGGHSNERQDHAECRRGKGPLADWVSHEHRLRLRRGMMADPEFLAWCASEGVQERACGSDEPEEPTRLP